MANMCPCCGSGVISVASSYPATVEQCNSLGVIQILACMDCGLYFAHPLPHQAALDDFYASGEYWYNLAPSTSVQGVHAYSQSLVRCTWVASRISSPPQQIADIGAGQGWMSLTVGKAWRGSDLCYDFLEPDDKAAETILRSGVQPARRRLYTLPSQPEYDLIFLNQVLEHTVAPLQLLTALKAGLKPDGYLYIETPHRDDRFKENVFPHMLFLDSSALENLCSFAGMEVVALESFGRMPAARGLLPRTLRAGFGLASVFGLRRAACALDKKLWGYTPRSDGIWLRALLRKPDGGNRLITCDQPVSIDVGTNAR